MKKIVPVMAFMVLLLVGLASATVTVIDDFDSPDGAMDTSSQNNLGGFYSGEGGCSYLSGEAYCISSDHYDNSLIPLEVGYSIDFDFKANPDGTGLVWFADGVISVPVVSLNFEDTYIFYSNGSSTAYILIGDYDYHNITILFDSWTTNALYLDGVFVGNYTNAESRNLSDLDIYSFMSSGSAFHFDNLTVDDGVVEPEETPTIVEGTGSGWVSRPPVVTGAVVADVVDEPEVVVGLSLWERFVAWFKGLLG